MTERYFCKNPRRHDRVKERGEFNGIDFLEVADADVPVVSFKQRILLVHCLLKLTPADWSRDNVSITGGVRVTGVAVTFAGVLSGVDTTQFPTIQSYLDGIKADPDANKVLLVITDVRGDFSDYDLTLRASLTDPDPPPKFDPMLRSVVFRFKVGCPSDFDCRTETVCVNPTSEPELDYLAKDYASFRQLMLDRMSVLMPNWKERNPADLQIALVELLAYTGDHLSYFQDWAATEAYLRTARSRISVRRHARLLDYFMHDGSNARTWIAFEVDAGADGLVLRAGTPVLSGQEGAPVMAPKDEFKPLIEPGTVFETMEDLKLRLAHNHLDFHTWSNEECCLPSGATSATLVHKAGVQLVKGSTLIFEEVLNPETGEPAGINRLHRHAVRLTEVTGVDDAKPVTDPVEKVRVIEISWHAEDALPFPLCLSARVTHTGGKEGYTQNISIARANVVLADHGASIPAQEPIPKEAPSGSVYRPKLPETPVTQRCPLPAAGDSASSALLTDPGKALPFLRLEQIPLPSPTPSWTPVRDLLSTDAFARSFVLEVESDGASFVRFGDDTHGRSPEAGLQFTAIYRIGTGAGGNVGADSLTRVVLDGQGIKRVWNPLPGTGGCDPESAERVKLVAPEAFRVQKRAVTEANYAATARLNPEVQNATARFRWTGSWYTVYLTVDRKSGLPIDAQFRDSLLELLDAYRMAGHDIELRPPLFVPLDLKLRVCVSPGYFRSNVERALLDALSSRQLPGGKTGFFHPDRFTFAQRVYLSQVYQVAMSTPGVESVLALSFQRYGQLANRELDDGFIPAGETEILRLDNDPNFPENGKLEFDMRGGL